MTKVKDPMQMVLIINGKNNCRLTEDAGLLIDVKAEIFTGDKVLH